MNFSRYVFSNAVSLKSRLFAENKSEHSGPGTSGGAGRGMLYCYLNFRKEEISHGKK